METTAYRGKHFVMPALSAEGIRITPRRVDVAVDESNPIVACCNSIWDPAQFRIPRVPLSIAMMNDADIEVLEKAELPRVLDLPIRFPGSDYRLPRELAALKDLVQTIADYEEVFNKSAADEYYCYLTVDRGVIRPGQCLREAPCHVDGFQGARWQPKVRLNHTYTLSNVLPTTYYVQPFDFTELDERRHDFFWEMNRQVALTNSLYAWRPEPRAITLMDAYTVHRGTESDREQLRTFVRLSFEVRIFDRLGNAHNPMFRYAWPMVPRDIEALSLAPFDSNCDPTLRVFPHQKPDGTPWETRQQKTQPRLRIEGMSRREHLSWMPPRPLLASSGWVYGDELRKLVG